MKKVILTICIILIAICNANSQFSSNDITEGRDYWIAIPHCEASKDEPVRWGIYPIELWITSKVNTVCQVTSADGSMNESHAVIANSIKVITISDVLMNKKSEVVTKKGIRITSKNPISVNLFMAYKWSGESYRAIPVEWLGKTYVTANMYQDRTKMHSGETDDKPGQIIIVASQDNTTVTYEPTAETEIGIKPGAKNTVKLNKGETFLIEAKILPALNQDWKTDLTGTYISANKPIGVISGHTKGAFPRYTASMYGIKADFMRNMLIEMLPSIELLGSEYVSVPLKYTNRPYTAGVENEKGDIIRFVATEDGTNIFQMRSDGTGLKQISTNLKRGQWYDIIEQQVAAYYKSNKKILVAQYGKSWLDHVPPPTVGKEEENPQNPSRNGQGMMSILTPIEKWSNNAIFYSVPNLSNFFYITFKATDLNNILFDGQYIVTKYGSAIKQIQGTDFVYLISEINSGYHKISSENNARFSGIAYGNFDYSKDGFAYGYPIGIMYSNNCKDSLTISDNNDSVNVDGKFEAIDLIKDQQCAGIFSISLSNQSTNYTLVPDNTFAIGDKSVNFILKVIDPNIPAYAQVTSSTLSGLTLTKTYNYTPDIIAEIADADWGKAPIGIWTEKSIEVANLGKNDLIINSVSWDDSTYFRNTNIKPPFVIKGGSKSSFKAYFFSRESGINYSTTAVFSANTNKNKLTSKWNVISYGSEPDITAINWGTKLYGKLASYDDSVKGYYEKSGIKARGNADLTNLKIYIDNDFDGVFSLDTTKFPNLLTANADWVYIPVYFKPNSDKSFSAELVIECEFSGYKKINKSNLFGVGATGLTVNENSKNYTIISPNPASDYIEISLDSPSIKRGQGGVSFEIFNIFGEKNPTLTLTVEEGTGIVLPNGKDLGGVFKIDVSNLVPGVYFIRIGNRFEKFIKL
jgi:hypothetical protein